MSEIKIDIDITQFKKDLFLQRVPSSIMAIYNVKGHLVEFVAGANTYHFCYQISDNSLKKDTILRELNAYFGPMEKDLYNYVCSKRRTYL